MKRAIKISLKFITDSKRIKIEALLDSYRAAVNFYIHSLWHIKGALDKSTLARFQHTRLSERYKSQALKQALSIVISTKKSAKALGVPCSIPYFKGGACLDAKFVSIETGEHSFDLMIKLSVLKEYHRIWLPCKKTKMFNTWLEKPLAKLIQGCILQEDYIILWIEIPDFPEKKTGKVLGVDIGANKLLSDSEGNHYGTEFKSIRNKVGRRKAGSKNKKQARTERDQYINKVVKQLPWDKIKVLGIEELKDVKKGKKKNRNKNFRKAMAPWTYRRVIEALRRKSQENRVHLVEIEPAYTSRICPKCGKESKDNRKGEKFLCISCGYKGDADYIGAQNILARTLATLRSVVSLKL